MYVHTRNGDPASLHASPDSFSQVNTIIPHGTKVDAVFFDGLWYCIKWKGISGFMPAIFLSMNDPSPARWMARYGAGTTSILQEKRCSRQTANIQHDLNYFFDPFVPHITIDGFFGQETREALILFQKIRGLRPDGVAWPETKESLLVASLWFLDKDKRR